MGFLTALPNFTIWQTFLKPQIMAHVLTSTCLPYQTATDKRKLKTAQNWKYH